jgi:hypothetical protein
MIRDWRESWPSEEDLKGLSGAASRPNLLSGFVSKDAATGTMLADTGRRWQTLLCCSLELFVDGRQVYLIDDWSVHV